MNTNVSREVDRSRLLAKVGRIGWWEADFVTLEISFSDYLVNLFGLKKEVITFQEFGNMIREDYRERMNREILSIEEIDVYEQVFPVYSAQGLVWVCSRLGKKWKNEEGHLLAFGMTQLTDTPEDDCSKKVLGKFNDLLFCQQSISRSLRYFMKERNNEETISKVLKEVLDYFHAGRVYILEYDREYRIQNCTYEVVAEDVQAEIGPLQPIESQGVKWWTEHILADKPILLENISDLPAEARVEYEMLLEQKVKSLMVIPLQGGDGIWGCMGIDVVDRYCRWTNEDYQWFSSLSNIISICISLRRAKDEAMRERSFLRNLYRHMPVGYVRMSLICDENDTPYDYRITDANQFSADLCGVPLNFYLGRTASEIYGKEKVQEKLHYLLQVQGTDGYCELDDYFKATNKNCHCIVYLPEKKELVCLLVDLTESKRAYVALDRSEKLLRNIFSNIPVGVEIYDKEGFLTDLNRKDCEIFGIKNRKDVIGVNLFDNPNIPPEIAERVRKEDEVDFSLFYKFKSINDYYLSEKSDSIDLYAQMSKIYGNSGDFFGYILINIDNTERITSMNRIRDFENLFLMISDYARVGYAKLNMLDRKGYAIKQWYKNMGEDESTPLTDIVGVYSKIHPEDRKRVIEFFEQAEKGQAKNFRGEIRVLNPEDAEQWNWVRMNIVVTQFEPQNGMIELIGVNYDITELKEAEKELIVAKEKAETADRLKSAFLANMSHEIRTPLNAIVGFSSLMGDSECLDEKKEYLEIVEENNALLLQLISDILDLSKIEAGTFDFKYKDFDLNQLCEDIVRAMQLRVVEGVQLTFESSMPKCVVFSDANRLYQVISNFVGNAVKFTHYGSIRVGYEMQNDCQVRVYVQDTGIGIAPAYQKQVFERFVKLNTFAQGTGLGLSICRSIIEQMGGTIGVDSEINKGACFWFVIPINRHL